jgi:hypothetical protein
MKNYDKEPNMNILIILTLTVVLIQTWSYVIQKFDMKEDSAMEECIERLIEEELDLPDGILDFTPDSEE